MALRRSALGEDDPRTQELLEDLGRQSLDEIQKLLNPSEMPEFEACATTGEGVFETLKAVARLVLRDLKQMNR